MRSSALLVALILIAIPAMASGGSFSETIRPGVYTGMSNPPVGPGTAIMGKHDVYLLYASPGDVVTAHLTWSGSSSLALHLDPSSLLVDFNDPGEPFSCASIRGSYFSGEKEITVSTQLREGMERVEVHVAPGLVTEETRYELEIDVNGESAGILIFDDLSTVPFPTMALCML